MERGHRVVTAVDGNDGLEAFRRDTFDVIVADYQMPGLDGARFFQQVTDEHPVGQPLRRVMVTGRPRGDGTLPECIDALLRKPFDTGEIIKIVEGLSNGDLEDSILVSERLGTDPLTGSV